MSENELYLDSVREVANCVAGPLSLLGLFIAYKIRQHNGQRLLDTPIAYFETESTDEEIATYLMSMYEEQLAASNGEVKNLTIAVGEGKDKIVFTKNDYLFFKAQRETRANSQTTKEVSNPQTSKVETRPAW